MNDPHPPHSSLSRPGTHKKVENFFRLVGAGRSETCDTQPAALQALLPAEAVYFHRQANLEDVFLRDLQLGATGALSQLLHRVPVGVEPPLPDVGVAPLAGHLDVGVTALGEPPGQELLGTPVRAGDVDVPDARRVRTLTEREPGHARAFTARARALRRLGRHGEAATPFTDAIEAYLPRGRPPPELYLERARSLAASGPGTLGQAIRAIDEGLRTLGEVSCWNGRFAALNVTRWRRGADGFPGPLSAYRRYVLNHEVGHGLGYDHRACPRRGARAPVMQQQTFRTRPCRPNGWPVKGPH